MYTYILVFTVAAFCRHTHTRTHAPNTSAPSLASPLLWLRHNQHSTCTCTVHIQCFPYFGTLCYVCSIIQSSNKHTAQLWWLMQISCGGYYLHWDETFQTKEMKVVALVTKWVPSNYYKTWLWNVRAACDIERRAFSLKIVVKNGTI
jgi:hypothetical protein